jgi:hypothetical protein
MGVKSHYGQQKIGYDSSVVGPWLWKEVKIKEEKVECALRGRHSNCYWGEVRKREEKMERSMEKKVVG